MVLAGRLLLLIMVTQPLEAAALTFSLCTPKKEYYRHDLVLLEARIEGASGEPVPGLKPEVRAYMGDSLVENELGKIRLKYDAEDGAYTGGWPIPFNPRIGQYRIEVVVPLRDDRYALKNSTSILVRGRRPARMDTSMCVMTIEAQTDLIRHPVSDPRNDRWDWRNFTVWADLLCANTILYSVGWTIEGQTTAENPWVAAGPATVGKLAEEARRKGFKFGGWIGTFLVWGQPKLGLGYDYSWEYEEGKLRRNHHVRLDDKKRIGDIAKLAASLGADPNVDFVGFDYIRPGPGGLEMVDDFVDSLCIPTPAGWDGLTLSEKMRWLGRTLWDGRDSVVCARWEWWTAHRSASTLSRILESAQLKKPVWVFVLGWDKGHEHGQDPIMMNDAGADFCAVMFYESTAQQEKAMTKQWSEYLVGDEVNLIVGEAVDWELMGKSKEPEAPQEFAIRLGGGIRGVSRDHPARGLFWHDLTRTHWGSPGPYSRMEWVNAGAAAFTRLREEKGELPFRTRVIPGRKETRIIIENLTEEPLENLKVTFVKTPGTTISDALSKTVPLVPGISRSSVFFSLRPDSRSMVAFRVEWRGFKAVDFEYYPNPYRANPFREHESVHAGGDVLVISPATSDAYSVGICLRGSSYSCNRVSLQNLRKGVVKKYRYVVAIGEDLGANPEVAGEIRDYLSTGGRAVFLSCDGLSVLGITGGGSPGSVPYIATDRTSITSIVSLLESL